MSLNYTTREERNKIVEECLQSGKTQAAFARENGIKPKTLSYWITRFKRKSENQSPDNHFVELKSSVIRKEQNIIIRKSGIEIEVPAECKQELIKSILSAAASL